MSDNKNGAKASSGKVQPGALSGKLFTTSGERLVQVQASKKGRRYRYYVSETITNGPAKEYPDAWRLPAQELENTVAQCAIRLLSDEGAISSTLHKADVSGQDMVAVLNISAEFCKQLASEVYKNEALKLLVERIDLKPDGMSITLALKALFPRKSFPSKEFMLRQDIAMQMRRRGVETKLIIEGGHTVKIDMILLRTIAKAHIWAEELFLGKVPTMAIMASREKIDKGTLSRMMDLAFLAPNIVEAIVAGRQPSGLTTQWLLRDARLPLEWEAQKTLIS